MNPNYLFNMLGRYFGEPALDAFMQGLVIQGRPTIDADDDRGFISAKAQDTLIQVAT